MSNIYQIPVEWLMVATVEIQANSFDEAIEIAKQMPLEEIPAQYCDDSFEVNYELAIDLNPEDENATPTLTPAQQADLRERFAARKAKQ